MLAWKIHRRHRAGFTLIEIVAVLILTSIALTFGAMLFVTSTQNFVASKAAMEDAQKVQVAMNRLVKELTYAGKDTVVVSNARSVEWTSHHPNRFGATVIASWNGTAGSDLTLQGIPLLDNVRLFRVDATEDAITLTLQSTRNEGVAHTTTVHPRYEF